MHSARPRVRPMRPPILAPTLALDVRPAARRMHAQAVLAELAEPGFREPGLGESRLAERLRARVEVVVRHRQHRDVVRVAVHHGRRGREAVFGRCQRASRHDFGVLAVVGEDVRAGLREVGRGGERGG